jgi:hypothetical protein
MELYQSGPLSIRPALNQDRRFQDTLNQDTLNQDSRNQDVYQDSLNQRQSNRKVSRPLWECCNQSEIKLCALISLRHFTR